MTVCVFSGPTIGDADVQRLLPQARLYPPVAHGDLGRIHWQPGDVAVIIDGLFQEAPSVRHKEILTLIQRGIVVCGASSMGALRAAELHCYGMIGVGLIFRLYRTGILTRDDEVAVAHTPPSEGARPLSVALVTIRVAASRARRAGIIGSRDEQMIVSAAADLPYFGRQWKTIANAAVRRGVDAAMCDAFTSFCLSSGIDVKRDDAIRLLRQVAKGKFGSSRDIPRSAQRALKTHFQLTWELDGQGVYIRGSYVSDLTALRCLQLCSPDFPQFYRRLCLQLVAAEHRDVPFAALNTAADAEIEDAALAALGRLGLGSSLPTRSVEWFGLTQTPNAPTTRQMLLSLLVRSYRHEPGVVPLGRAAEILHTHSAYRAAQDIVADAAAYLEAASRVDERCRYDHVSEEAVNRCLALLWHSDVSRSSAQDRGFPSLKASRKAVRALVPYLLQPDHAGELSVFQQSLSLARGSQTAHQPA